MRKLNGKSIVSAVVTAALLSSVISVSATDYVMNPTYTAPESAGSGTVESPTTIVDDSKVDDAIKGEGTVYVEPDNAEVKASAIAAIKDGGKTVTFNAGEYSVSIDPNSISETANDINVAMDITASSSAVKVDGVEVPAGAVVIDPAATGDFGMTLTVTIPASKVSNTENLALYYIDDNGNVEKVENALTVNADGSVSISINHASKYVISDQDLTAKTDDSGKEEPSTQQPEDTQKPADEKPAEKPADGANPETGVGLALGTVALAAVSAAAAVAAKKRK